VGGDELVSLGSRQPTGNILVRESLLEKRRRFAILTLIRRSNRQTEGQGFWRSLPERLAFRSSIPLRNI